MKVKKKKNLKNYRAWKLQVTQLCRYIQRCPLERSAWIRAVWDTCSAWQSFCLAFHFMSMLALFKKEIFGVQYTRFKNLVFCELCKKAILGHIFRCLPGEGGIWWDHQFQPSLSQLLAVQVKLSILNARYQEP